MALEAAKQNGQNGQSALQELVEVIKLHAEKFGHPLEESLHSVSTRQHPRGDADVIAVAPYGLGLCGGSHHETSLEKKYDLSPAGNSP